MEIHRVNDKTVYQYHFKWHDDDSLEYLDPSVLAYPDYTLYLRTDVPISRVLLDTLIDVDNLQIFLKGVTNFFYFFRAHEYNFVLSFEEALAVTLIDTVTKCRVHKWPNNHNLTPSPLFHGGLMRSIVEFL